MDEDELKDLEVLRREAPWTQAHLIPDDPATAAVVHVFDEVESRKQLAGLFALTLAYLKKVIQLEPRQTGYVIVAHARLPESVSPDCPVMSLYPGWKRAQLERLDAPPALSLGPLGSQESWCLFPISRYRGSTAAAKSSTFACERSWPSATRTRASGKLYFTLVKIDYDGNVPDSAWGSSSQVHEVCRLDFFIICWVF